MNCFRFDRVFASAVVASSLTTAQAATSADDATTPLHQAVYQEDLEATRRIAQAEANIAGKINAPNRYGMTPLALACINGNGPIVELLLKYGADPKTLLPGGESVLMTAARTGKVEAVRALIAHGADVNASEPVRGQTALMWAAADGNAQVVEELIKAGADFRTRLSSGFSPLLFAVREGNADVVRALLKAGADVNDTVVTQSTATFRPASGAGVPRAGNSALHLAVVNGHFELASMLLDEGADPNAAGVGYTVLHMITIVRKPGGGDNDPAPRGSGTMTSLELVKKLAKRDANLNARMTRRLNLGLTGLNTIGATPFLLAARSADAELMRTLASLGADPLLPNADNSTPLMVAAGLGTRSPGEDAGVESEVLEAVQLALELGNDINAVSNQGETAMHGAAYKNVPSVVQFLADKGAKIDIWNRKNKHGWTPLTIAEGHRFGNFKPSPETIAALRRVMLAAGVTPPEAPIAMPAKNSEYAPKP